MSWQAQVFKNFKFYAVTNLESSDPGFLKKVERAYVSGVDILQLRSKSISVSEKIKLGHAIRKIARRLKKLYFVNDSLEIALLTQADGLHVGQDDLPPKIVRMLCRKWGRKIYLGLSSHSEAQARQAQKEPVDYFAVGPVFSTPTKPSYQPVGLQLVEKVNRFAVKPWVAIGGINAANLDQVLAAGARRVAMVRAVFDGTTSEKISLLTQKLKRNVYAG